ncbi:MAG: PfkB family carbohydrate kinase [Deltaproteobacteria bacterium]|jgi:rfaE bifunctional protein kinase chain/domain|nr:PfkB family carbohydrate kinase [Deltaproteobacteria bacterium]
MTSALPECSKLIAKLARLKDAPVMIVGDVLLDEYLFGDASRLSPEAPVPVVLIEEERFMLGGAGNVARNIRALGGKPKLISVCGDGHNSGKLRKILKNECIDADLLPLPGRPASTKTRIMARRQQLVRIDREDASPITPEETARILDKIAAAWSENTVLVISDYNKGLINKAFMDGLQILRQKRREEIKILVDPKTPNFPLYQRVDILTPNATETKEASGLPVHGKEEIIAAGQAIFAKNHCQSLLTTLGSQGMALFQGPNNVLHIPTVARKVFDVSGAGDTVIATLAMGMAGGINLLEACTIANFAAGNVVAEVGTATTSIEKIAEAITSLGQMPVERWL